MEIIDGHDWRKESGKLLASKREGYRLFLSHKTEVKRETVELKENFKIFGIAAFVAHDDIRPTAEWQNEIENALFSMDEFVALITKNFHDSDWTDQEVGLLLDVVCQ